MLIKNSLGCQAPSILQMSVYGEQFLIHRELLEKVIGTVYLHLKKF